MKCNCESDSKRFHDISPQWLNAFVHSPEKKYNLRRRSKAFQPLETAGNWKVQYRNVISFGNWFWKIVVKYSKNPHIRTKWIKNLQAEIWHLNTQKYKNMFRQRKIGSYTKKITPILMVKILDFNKKSYCVYVFFDLHLFGFSREV